MRAPTARSQERAVLRRDDQAERASVLEIVSSIAHEMRAPLSTLTAAAEMIESGDQEAQQRFACAIQRQARRLNSIVDALLRAYGATSVRQSAATDGPPDVAELIRELCCEQAHLYPGHRVAVESERLRPLAIDRDMFAIALSNLISNAAKYSPPGSTIYVSAHHYEDSLRVVVEDEGPGLSPAASARMFRPGIRGAAHAAEGFGLGLFISRTVCRAMGGDLIAEPSSRTRGARFAIEIPGAAGD